MSGKTVKVADKPDFNCFAAVGVLDCGSCRIPTSATSEVEWNDRRTGLGIPFEFG